MCNVFLQQPYFNISGKKIFGLILRKDEKFLSLIHLKKLVSRINKNNIGIINFNFSYL